MLYRTFFLLSLSLHTQANDRLESLNGTWSNYCDEDGPGYSAIIHNKSNELLIKISSGQIHINAKAETIPSKHSYDIYFSSTNDLGPGGMKYDWSKASLKIPIARIYQLSSQNYKMSWLGIYNIETNKTLGLSTEFTNDNLLTECITPDY
jgi:hypothetical protein